MIINQKNNFLTYLILILSWLFLGGSNGTLSLFILLLMAVFLTVLTVKRNQTLNNHFMLIKGYLSISILLTAFIILYLGPGNNVRSASFESISIIDSFIYNFKICAIIIINKIPTILPPLIMFSIPFYWLGTQLNKKSPISLKYILIYSSLLLGLFIYIFQLPLTYKTQDIGAERTLFPIAIFIVSYFFFIFYQIGRTKLIKSKKINNYLFIASILTIIIFNSYNLLDQYPVVKKYAFANDQRIQLIKKSTGSNIIKLNPLPESGFIYSNEISNNPLNFKNQHLKNGLAIDGEIMVKP